MPSACFIGLQIGKADPYETADTKMPQLAPRTKIVDMAARNTPSNGDLGDGEGDLLEWTLIHDGHSGGSSSSGHSITMAPCSGQCGGPRRRAGPAAMRAI